MPHTIDLEVVYGNVPTENTEPLFWVFLYSFCIP